VSGGHPEGDLCQTLLIVSKDILGRPLRGWVWTMRKKDVIMVVTPVDAVRDVMVLVGGSEKLDGPDARRVGLR